MRSCDVGMGEVPTAAGAIGNMPPHLHQPYALEGRKAGKRKRAEDDIGQHDTGRQGCCASPQLLLLLHPIGFKTQTVSMCFKLCSVTNDSICYLPLPWQPGLVTAY